MKNQINMQGKTINFTFLILLFVILNVSCGEDDLQWTQINAVTMDGSLVAELNSTFSEANDCLILTGNSSQMKVLFSNENFQALDNCNTVPVIDFDQYTLIGGRINVTSTSNEIASVNLSLLDNKYKVEVNLGACTECEPHGFIYFWRVFPKLEYGYTYDFDVN